MSGIHPSVTRDPNSHPGWAALAADLDALDGRGDLHSRRRGVALRLVAAGLAPEALESVLPGWGHYLAGPQADDAEAVA